MIGDTDSSYREARTLVGQWTKVSRGGLVDARLGPTQMRTQRVEKNEALDVYMCVASGALPGRKLRLLGTGQLFNDAIISPGDDFYFDEELLGTVLGVESEVGLTTRGLIIASDSLITGNQLDLAAGDRFYLKHKAFT